MLVFFLLLLPVLSPSPATSFLPTHGINDKGFSCSVTLFGCHSMRLPPCFLVELSSTLRKVLDLLKISWEGRSGTYKPLRFPLVATARDFVLRVPFPSKLGSAVSLILARRPIEFQPGICWGF